MNLFEIQQALNGFGIDHWNSAILFAEARDPEQWGRTQTTAPYQNNLAVIKKYAAKYLREPLRTLPYSLFRLFTETGSRIEYEKEYFEHRARLNAFAILGYTNTRTST